MVLVILPSLCGEDTYIKRFLTHPLLVPISRMTFTAYLTHLFWVYRNYYSAKSSFTFTHTTVLFNTLANGAIAFASGCILSLLAEVPLSNIESTYITRKKKPRKPRVTEEPAGNDDSASTSKVTPETNRST